MLYGSMAFVVFTGIQLRTCVIGQRESENILVRKCWELSWKSRTWVVTFNHRADQNTLASHLPMRRGCICQDIPSRHMIRDSIITPPLPGDIVACLDQFVPMSTWLPPRAIELVPQNKTSFDSYDGYDDPLPSAILVVIWRLRLYRSSF